jgi:hypothetical protein
MVSFSLTLSAYLSVFRVWSADDAAGDTAAIMTVLAFDRVNESLSTRVSLLAL